MGAQRLPMARAFSLWHMFALKHRPACANLIKVLRNAISPTDRVSGKTVVNLSQRHNRSEATALGQPQVQIRLIEVIMKGCIKSAQLTQHRPAHRHVGPFGFDRATLGRCQHGGLFWINLKGCGCPKLIQSARLPLKRNAIAPPNKAASGGDLGAGKWRDQKVQPLWLWHGVIVDKRHHITSCMADPDITRGRDVGIVKGNAFQSIGKGQSLNSGDPLPVCHNDDLKGGILDLRKPRQRPSEQRGSAPADDNDAHGDCCHSKPIFAIIDSIFGTSSGLFSSQNSRPFASTSTHRTDRPFSMKRSCSNPSRVSSGPVGQPG